MLEIYHNVLIVEKNINKKKGEKKKKAQKVSFLTLNLITKINCNDCFEIRALPITDQDNLSCN